VPRTTSIKNSRPQDGGRVTELLDLQHAVQALESRAELEEEWKDVA